MGGPFGPGFPGGINSLDPWRILHREDIPTGQPGDATRTVTTLISSETGKAIQLVQKNGQGPVQGPFGVTRRGD